MNNPFNQSKQFFIRNALEDNPSASAVGKVHAAVWGTVQYVVYNKKRLQFFNADTGLGKTTGFQQAIKRAWDSLWSDMPVLIMVPTRHDAERMFRAMEALEEGCAGVWTMSHDPETKAPDKHFTPLRYFTKEEAARTKCLIVTHNAGRECEQWVGRRDIVFVDEDPKPTSTDSFQPYQFLQARDEEARAGPYGFIFAEAARWAEDQEAQGLTPVTIPDWVEKVLAVSPVTSAGQDIKKLAEAITEGRAFQSRSSATSWVSFKYDLPFLDRTIIFSATAKYEGWQYGEDREFIDNLLPKIDYSSVTFKLKQWPVGLTKRHKEIIANRTNRNRFFEEVKAWIPWASSETLIVCPKDFRSDIEAMYPEAMVTNYGRDVGSNEFRGCKEVYIISEFHKPVDALRADYLGHSGVETVTEDCLQPIQNSQGSLMRELKDNNHRVHLKQMIARSNLRNIDADGRAGEVTVHCMIDEDRFTRLLPELFPGCKLVYPEGAASRAYTGSRDTTMIVTKAMQYLSQVPEEQEFVGSPELREQGIWIKGKARQKKIAEAESQFLSLGWFFRKGSAGRYATPSGFQRF